MIQIIIQSSICIIGDKLIIDRLTTRSALVPSRWPRMIRSASRLTRWSHELNLLHRQIEPFQIKKTRKKVLIGVLILSKESNHPRLIRASKKTVVSVQCIDYTVQTNFQATETETISITEGRTGNDLMTHYPPR